MKKIVLLGGGGHGRACIDVIECEGKYKIVAILDLKEKIGEKVFNYKITGEDSDADKYIKEGCYFLITVGQIKSPEKRVKMYENLKKRGAKMATVISPRAYVSDKSIIREGTIVMHDAIVNTNSFIGENCTINSKSLIEHDCIIKNHCHIAISAVLAGGVEVGEKSFIGANATVVQTVKIPANSFIKAGSLVK